MLHPIYWEIQVTLLALLFVAFIALTIGYALRVRSDNIRLAHGLQEAWDRERYYQVKARNSVMPEDWSLRGLEANWEEAYLQTNKKNSDLLARAVASLSDEEFASLVLLEVERRLEVPEVNDKVFTRLAGRVFRKVEQHRKARLFDPS